MWLWSDTSTVISSFRCKTQKKLKCTINIPCSSELTFCTLVTQFIHRKEMHWTGISQCCWNEEGFADFQLQTRTRNCSGKFVPAFHLTMTWEGKKTMLFPAPNSFIPLQLSLIFTELLLHLNLHTQTASHPFLFPSAIREYNNCSSLAPGQDVWRH